MAQEPTVPPPASKPLIGLLARVLSTVLAIGFIALKAHAWLGLLSICRTVMHACGFG